MIAKISVALVATCLAGTVTLAQNAQVPTDPQIAHIAYTAGVIDVQAAKNAIAKSKNRAVVSFARDMIRDHEAVNVKALALVKNLHVTPEDNATSRSLSQSAAENRKRLSKLGGAAFDKAYCLPQAGERGSCDAADPLSSQRTVEEPPRDRVEDFSGPRASRGDRGRRTQVTLGRALTRIGVGLLMMTPPTGFVWARTVRITVDNFAFSPANADARLGDTIQWINKDDFAHTATVKGRWM